MCLPCLRTPVYDLPGLYRRRHVAQSESASPGSYSPSLSSSPVASPRSVRQQSFIKFTTIHDECGCFAVARYAGLLMDRLAMAPADPQGSRTRPGRPRALSYRMSTTTIITVERALSTVLLCSPPGMH